MGTSAKAVIAFLFFLNLLAVCMGYVAIDKFERQKAGPFRNLDGVSRSTTFYAGRLVTDRTILFWHSPRGSLLIWAGTILLPLVGIGLIFGKDRPFTGTALLFLSFLPFGFTGFVIWFHAYVFLPHDR
jgi:hypothetical protein